MSFRGDNDRPLKEWLQIFASSPQLRDRLYQTRIESLWQETMGPLVVGNTRRLFLDHSRLFIYVESAPLRSELYRMRETIRTKVNQRIGEEIVTEVVVR